MIPPVKKQRPINGEATGTNKRIEEQTGSFDRLLADQTTAMEELKNKITQRLARISLNSGVSEVSVNFCSEFLLSCLENPQRLEDTLADIEKHFQKDNDEDHAASRVYIVWDKNYMKEQYMDTNKLLECGKNASGYVWTKKVVSCPQRRSF